MRFEKSTFIRASPERVFEFHLLPDAIERLVPPWENVKLVERADISKVGSRAVLEQRIFGIFPSRWIAEHTRYDPPRMFEDVQVSGPFRSWRHMHLIEPAAGGATLTDRIEFEPPFGILGNAFSPLLVVPRLEKMFEFRHSATKAWCENEV